jgi:hypothetical protein
MYNLIVTTPEQNSFSNPVVELREKAVKKWLSELPILNFIQSIPLLVNVLHQLNEEPADAIDRFKLLELYFEPFSSVFYSYDEVRLKSAPISDEQKKAIREGTAQLCQELASGYKLIAKFAAVQKKSPAKNKRFVLAVFRAMECISLGLLHAYRTYSAIPPFTLYELHQLYQFAKVFNFNQLNVNQTRGDDAPQSINELYIRAILLSISDPFRLPEGGAVQLCGFLVKFAPNCKINAYQNERTEGLFLLDLESDSSPIACNKLPSNLADYTDSKPESLLALNTRALINNVNNHVASNSEGSYSEEQALLKILLPNLISNNHSRKSSRNQTNQLAHIAVGTQAIEHFISLKVGEKVQTTEINHHGIYLDEAPEEDITQVSEHHLSQWRIINAALKGYKFICTNQCQSIAVGQLLAIKPESPSGQEIPFKLGIIRWMKVIDDTSFELGSETFPGTPKLVHIKGINNTFGGQRAIYVPATPALKIPASLFIEKNQIHIADELTVVTTQKSVRISVAKFFAQTQFFDAFYFKLAK